MDAFTFMPFRPLKLRAKNPAHAEMKDHMIPPTHPLNLRQDRFLEFSLNFLSRLICVRFAVQVEQSTQIEFRRLQELDFADVYVLERVDALGGLLNLATNDFWDELGGELSKGAAAGFTLDDLVHLLTDGSDLRGCSVGGLFDLIWATLGERNGEETEEVVISSLDSDVCLDQGLPLADEGSEFIGGEVETVEVGQAVSALNLIDTELDLAERVFLILLQIGQRDLEDTALERIVGVLETSCAVNESLSNISGLK